MNILVTGGFGFIGTNLIKRLLIDNHNLTIIDDLSSGSKIRNEDIVFHKLNIEDPKCEMIFENGHFDIVIHLAYKGYSKDNYQNSNENVYSNNLGLNNILKLSFEHKVKKVIILSSFKVYGHKRSNSFNEEITPQPVSSEGQSYLTREAIAREYNNLGLNVVTLRTGAVYGAVQYGTDLSYLDDTESSKGDLIYIDDLSFAISKVILNQTDSLLNLSNGEGTDNLMDSSRIRYSLNWYPRVNWEEGKDLAWDKVVEEEQFNEQCKDKLERTNLKRYKELEVGIVFLITFYLSYLLKFRLGITVDLFILYVIFISIIYGVKYSITSILLSTIAFTWFSFSYENKTVLSFLYDLNKILYLTLYFIIGSGVGYFIDERRKKEIYLMEEMNQLNSELNFIKSLFSKALIVNKNLKNTIQSYDNSLSKINSIVEKLKLLSKENILLEIPNIYREHFNSEDVSFYTLSDDNSTLRIRSSIGKNKLGYKIKITEHDFIKNSIKMKDIYVSREISKETPIITIPIFIDNSLFGIVFLNNVRFKSLNQMYVNKLRITTKLISNLIYQSINQQKTIGGS